MSLKYSVTINNYPEKGMTTKYIGGYAEVRKAWEAAEEASSDADAISFNVLGLNGEERPEEVVYINFTLTELSRAFRRVQNKDDWKEEIVAYIDPSETDVTLAAIEFYTATTAEVSPVNVIDSNGNLRHRVKVVSIGYRRGPAGG